MFGEHDSHLGKSPKRGWQGLRICVLCSQTLETVDHLFTWCSFSKIFWQTTAHLFLIVDSWGTGPIDQCLQGWSRDTKTFECLPIFIWWHIWLMGNCLIFKDKPPNYHSCAAKAIGGFNEFYNVSSIKKNPHSN